MFGACPLYPRKRTLAAHAECPLSANSGHRAFFHAAWSARRRAVFYRVTAYASMVRQGSGDAVWRIFWWLSVALMVSACAKTP